MFLEWAYFSHLLHAGTRALTADFGDGEYLTLTTNKLYGTVMYACCPTLIFEPNGNLFLVINQLNSQILFYKKFFKRLYMFRALRAHHQEVKIVLYSIWYRHTCRWLSRAQVGRGLLQGYF